jgi:hypothetical protein
VATAGKVVAVVASVAVVSAGAVQQVSHKASHPAKPAAAAGPRAAHTASIAVSAGALAERHPSLASTGASTKEKAAKDAAHARKGAQADEIVALDDAPPAAGTVATSGFTATHPGEEFSGGMAAPDEPGVDTPADDTVAPSNASGTSSASPGPLTAVTGPSQTTPGTTGTGTGSSTGSTGTATPSGSSSSSTSSTSSGSGAGSSSRTGTEQGSPPPPPPG